MKKYSKPVFRKDDMRNIGEPIFLLASGRWRSSGCYTTEYEMVQFTELGRPSFTFYGQSFHNAQDHTNYNQDFIYLFNQPIPDIVTSVKFNDIDCQIMREDSDGLGRVLVIAAGRWPKQNKTDAIGYGDFFINFYADGYTSDQLAAYLASIDFKLGRIYVNDSQYYED